VTWAPVEAPLVSLGGIHHKWIKDIPQDKGWFFSLIMNNIWVCNFKAGQGGKLTFRYALTSSKGPLDRLAASRFGAEVSSPLLCACVAGGSDGKLPEGKASFCSLQPENVIVQALKRAEDGRGLIVRLREVAGKQAAARVAFPLLGDFSARATDLVERDGQTLAVRDRSVQVSVAANGLATLRIVPKEGPR
jgi:alpha-mannosidase